MGRHKEAPEGWDCPLRNNCPHMEGLSASWMFAEYQRAIEREHQHWLIRESMAAEIDTLRKSGSVKDQKIKDLEAQLKLQHQRQFKPSKKKPKPSSTDQEKSGNQKAKRGAPKGHPAYTRPAPDHIDHQVHVGAPMLCPHCESPTDTHSGGQNSYIQEDIVPIPRTVVTEFIHDTAYCPHCRRQVIQPLPGELPFAPIGPNAKGVALYFRHGLKQPYRAVSSAMETLFGISFVPASILGFEKRARKNAEPIYNDLIEKMRTAPLVHADETHWRQDGHNCYLWFAGNESVATFRIDAHRSSEAAVALLGDKLSGQLVTDAYAAYNAIECEGGRQTCLVHLLRKSKEISEELNAMESADRASQEFCKDVADFFKDACEIDVPKTKKARKALVSKLEKRLSGICKKKALAHHKAETLRKRLLPGSREYPQLFSFIMNGGPPSNNHAERAIRPMVIFRKICMGTRSEVGSENLSIFGSIAQTAVLQGAALIDVFKGLFAASPTTAQDAIFDPPP